MKMKDEYASTEDVLQKDKSVVSGKTLEKVGKTSTQIYGKPEKESKKVSTRSSTKTSLVKPPKQVKPSKKKITYHLLRKFLL